MSGTIAFQSADPAYYQQKQLTISRNSFLSAELPALHQQNTLVFISNHVAASRIISCILCSSVGFIQAFRANFTHILLFWDYQLSPLSYYLYNSQPGYCARTICVGCYNPPRTQLTAFYVQNCIQELSSNIPLNAKFRANSRLAAPNALLARRRIILASAISGSLTALAKRRLRLPLYDY